MRKQLSIFFSIAIVLVIWILSCGKAQPPVADNPSLEQSVPTTSELDSGKTIALALGFSRIIYSQKEIVNVEAWTPERGSSDPFLEVRPLSFVPDSDHKYGLQLIAGATGNYWLRFSYAGETKDRSAQVSVPRIRSLEYQHALSAQISSEQQEGLQTIQLPLSVGKPISLRANFKIGPAFVNGVLYSRSEDIDSNEFTVTGFEDRVADLLLFDVSGTPRAKYYFLVTSPQGN